MYQELIGKLDFSNAAKCREEQHVVKDWWLCA
jgi:hypothetical protein